VNNNKHHAAGFVWRRADRTAAAGEWLFELAVALAAAVIALFIGMVADAHAQPRSEGGAIVSADAGARAVGNPAQPVE
jgi:hypothetical protein